MIDFPWLRLALAVMLILVVIFAAGCTPATFYRDGKPIARFGGDMSGVKFRYSAKGDLTWQADKVDASAPILARGKAVAGVAVAAGGIAAYSLK